MRLQNRTAVITGGSSGVGRGIAIEMAKEGADIVVGDLRREPLRDDVGAPTVEVVRELGRESVYVEMDVAEPPDAERLITRAVDEFGGLDILVNNAAYFPKGSIEELTEADWDRTFDVNVKAIYNTCRVGMAHIRQSDQPRIINLASQLGMEGTRKDAPSYAASKGAIISLTRQLAVEYADENIPVNAIAPGIIKTSATIPKLASEDKGPIIRGNILLPFIGEPKDIGRTAVYLASEDARYMTGHTLVIDGGYTAH